MADDNPESPQRWTAKPRATLILSILKGETSAQAAARKHGLTVAEVEEWRDRFLLGAENALRARPKDEGALKDEQIKRLKQKGRAARSDERWATDLTHVYCGRDGWAHLAAVIDCHDRELIGHEFALRGRAKEAERALEEACLERFGTLRPGGATPVVRSDNGLIYQSRCFRAACRDYRLTQEFIMPYTPEQNGMIERFVSFEHARRELSAWIRWYNEERPHQALGYRSPREFRAHEVAQVA